MTSLRQLALFGHASDGLALRAEMIEAVLERLDMFRLPGLPEGFEGVCLFRDEPVPVLSSEPFLTGLSLEACYVAVCRTEMGPVAVPVPPGGMIVEACDGLLEKNDDSASVGSAERFIFRNAHYQLLDLERLLLLPQC